MKVRTDSTVPEGPEDAGDGRGSKTSGIPGTREMRSADRRGVGSHNASRSAVGMCGSRTVLGRTTRGGRDGERATKDRRRLVWGQVGRVRSRCGIGGGGDGGGDGGDDGGGDGDGRCRCAPLKRVEER